MHRTIRGFVLAALVLFFCGTALLAVAQKRATPEPDYDKESLEKMKKYSGYDLSQPYKLVFLLVTSPECEKEAVLHLQEAGFEVGVESKDRFGTNLEARKTMVPELSALRKIRRDLVKSPCIDFYRGWEFDPDQDEAYLAQAKKTGYDLSKPYKLYFRWSIAPYCEKQVGSRLKQEGFEVEFWQHGTVGTVVVARKTIVPDLAALQKIRQDTTKSLCDSRNPAYYVEWGFVTNHFDGMVLK